MLLKIWRIPSSLTTESPTERMVLHHNTTKLKTVLQNRRLECFQERFGGRNSSIRNGPRAKVVKLPYEHEEGLFMMSIKHWIFLKFSVQSFINYIFVQTFFIFFIFV